MSAVVEAKGLINAKRLKYQSSDPTDLNPLTPNHFLHGQFGGRFAPDSVDAGPFNSRKRWRLVKALVRHFWHRWFHEWIPGLSASRKRPKDQVDLKVGHARYTHRYAAGKVAVENDCGSDSKVRVVDFQVGSTVLRRPIVKLFSFGKVLKTFSKVIENCEF